MAKKIADCRSRGLFQISIIHSHTSLCRWMKSKPLKVFFCGERWNLYGCENKEWGFTATLLHLKFATIQDGLRLSSARSSRADPWITCNKVPHIAGMSRNNSYISFKINPTTMPQSPYLPFRRNTIEQYRGHLWGENQGRTAARRIPVFGFFGFPSYFIILILIVILISLRGRRLRLRL